MSDAEQELAWQLEAARYKHERQYAYVPGRRFKADFAFPRHRLLIEVQGGVYDRRAHGSVSGVLADIERLNLATLGGWRVLRVLPEWCRMGDGRAFSLIEQAIAAPTRKPKLGHANALRALKQGDVVTMQHPDGWNHTRQSNLIKEARRVGIRATTRRVGDALEVQRLA